MKRFFVRNLFRINIIITTLLILSYLAVYINPQHFWPVAFLGLMYPFLLLANLLFVIIWGVALKPQAILSLVSILLGITFVMRYVQFDIPFVEKKELQDKNSSFKLLSFNVRLFNRYNWLKDKETSNEIFGFIQKESPDIICFQEFFTRDKGELSEKEVISHLKNTKYHFIRYTFQKPHANFGIATFSRYPIVNQGEIHFEKTLNSCIFTDVKIGSDTFRIYNNHLQSVRFIKKDYFFVDSLAYLNSQNKMSGLLGITYRLKWAFKIRAMQANMIAAHVRRSKYPVIVCGDFNDTPVSYTYQTMRQDLEDAFIKAGSGLGNTYLGKFPSYRIDYIFFDKRLSITNYRSPKLQLSDHYPVLCRMGKK